MDNSVEGVRQRVVGPVVPGDAGRHLLDSDNLRRRQLRSALLQNPGACPLPGAGLRDLPRWDRSHAASLADLPPSARDPAGEFRGWADRGARVWECGSGDAGYPGRHDVL